MSLSLVVMGVMFSVNHIFSETILSLGVCHCWSHGFSFVSVIQFCKCSTHQREVKNKWKELMHQQVLHNTKRPWKMSLVLLTRNLKYAAWLIISATKENLHCIDSLKHDSQYWKKKQPVTFSKLQKARCGLVWSLLIQSL